VFHGLVVARKKYGCGNAIGATSGIGWCMDYPFSLGDLTAALRTATAAIDAAPRVPWADLRYLVGDILYGGHVVEAPDRELVAAYLRRLLDERVLDGGELVPGLPPPPPGLSHAATLAWLAGCWQSELDEPGSGEQWMAPAGGSICAQQCMKLRVFSSSVGK
jgi:dynein heavy chain